MIHNHAMSGVLAMCRKERLHKKTEYHPALEVNILHEKDKGMFKINWVTQKPCSVQRRILADDDDTAWEQFRIFHTL